MGVTTTTTTISCDGCKRILNRDGKNIKPDPFSKTETEYQSFNWPFPGYQWPVLKIKARTPADMPQGLSIGNMEGKEFKEILDIEPLIFCSPKCIADYWTNLARNIQPKR